MKSIYTKKWFILTALFLIALAFRLVIIYILAWNKGLHFETVAIAKHIVAGEGYMWDWGNTPAPIPLQPTAILTPLYTYFIAFFLAVFGESARTIYIVQAVINSFGVVPCYYLGNLLGKSKTGFVLAGLYALFPEVAYMPTTLVAETLTIIPAILGIYLYLKYKSYLLRTSKVNGFLWLGLLLGIVTLAKANTAFMFLSFFICLLLTRFKRKTLFHAAFLLGLGFTVCISPWIIRNTMVMKEPVFRTMYGFNLWRGNHPGATGTARLDPKTTSEGRLDPEYRDYIKRNHPDTELEMDKFYKNEAMRFIKADLSRYIWLTVKRAIYFVTVDPTHPLTRNPVYIFGYLFILFFGIWGGIILKKCKRLDNIFYITPAVFMLFYIPVIILPRYRLILIWILLMLSSVSITKILSKTTIFSRLKIDQD